VFWYCLKSNDKSLLKDGHEGNIEQIFALKSFEYMLLFRHSLKKYKHMLHVGKYGLSVTQYQCPRGMADVLKFDTSDFL